MRLLKLNGHFHILSDEKPNDSDLVVFDYGTEIAELGTYDSSVREAIEPRKIIASTDYLAWMPSISTHQLMLKYGEAIAIGFATWLSQNSWKFNCVGQWLRTSQMGLKTEMKSESDLFSEYTKIVGEDRLEWGVVIEMDRMPADLAPNGWDEFPLVSKGHVNILKITL